MRYGLSAVVLAVVLLSGVGAPVRGQGSAPREAGINEKLGAQVALDSVLKDEDGKDITLRQLIGKPTILTLNYFTCTGICSPLLNALVGLFQPARARAGQGFPGHHGEL